MATYHFSLQIIGRSSGGSAVASAAYRATEKLFDETTNETFDYRRKTKALFSGIITPKNSPAWTHDRQQLWNEVEKKENRKNSAFCREINIAIPIEIKDKAKEVVENFIRLTFTSRGIIADYAIHAPNPKGDERNIHAHIMLTKRKITPEGWGKMDREADDFKTKKAVLYSWRKNWESFCNRELWKHGILEKISCETLEKQGIKREPQQHMGKSATAIQREGKQPKRGRYKIVELEEEPKITREELEEELIKDTEYNQLLNQLEKIRNLNQNDEMSEQISEVEQYIINTTPAEWKAFRDKEFPALENQSQQLSLIEAIKPYLKQLEEMEKKLYVDCQKKENEHFDNKPYEPAKPKLSFLYKFRASNGEIYTSYKDYEYAQKQIIATWSRVYEIMQNDTEKCKKNYQQVVKAEQTNDNKDIYEVVVHNKRTRPKFFQSLQKSAAEIVETGSMFKLFREIRSLVKKHQDQKNEELRQNNRRRNSHHIDRDNDFGYSR